MKVRKSVPPPPPAPHHSAADSADELRRVLRQDWAVAVSAIPKLSRAVTRTAQSRRTKTRPHRLLRQDSPPMSIMHSTAVLPLEGFDRGSDQEPVPKAERSASAPEMAIRISSASSPRKSSTVELLLRCGTPLSAVRCDASKPRLFQTCPLKAALLDTPILR